MKNDFKSAPDPRIIYADIIDLPHWESPTRPKMNLYNRAAQFSPFAALSGYDDIIQEEARITGTWIEPGESLKEQIDRKLNLIAEAIASRHKPAVRIKYFIPDMKKDGGEYITEEGTVRKIDPVSQRLILQSARAGIEHEIGFSRIAELLLL